MDPYRSRFQPTDPRLGRHVNHDPRSRSFPVRSVADVVSIKHVRHVPVFDQGNLGSCTGNAGMGCMGTGVFFATMDETEREHWPLTEEGAVGLYSEATRLDRFAGTYPPDDTGSDGLSVAKVLKRAGLISGYRHAFSLNQLLTGLMHTPCIVGTEWREEMFEPDDDATVRPDGETAGGHEYLCDQVIVQGEEYGPRGVTAASVMIGFTNSWGSGWGHEGRFYMTATDFSRLLKADGDATFFVPSDKPAPKPEEA